jgi:peptidoglycan/LPS O-acetylase OafA/YrhL
MPQLDSLRAIAVIGVMVHHFWPNGEVLLGLTTGFLGVQLFFVLSGFLITGILLRARDVVAAGLQSTTSAIRQFYIRRLLRIFPLFYRMLAVAWIVGLPEVRDSLPWHLTYATNVYFVHIEDWHGSVSHLWSLAVETVLPRLAVRHRADAASCAPPLLVGVVALAPASGCLAPGSAGTGWCGLCSHSRTAMRSALVRFWRTRRRMDSGTAGCGRASSELGSGLACRSSSCCGFWSSISCRGQ